jgi:hypothetical protein
LKKLKITNWVTSVTVNLSFSYVTKKKGEGKMERARGSKTAKSLSEHI